jgi:hypothetical protein
MTTADDSRGQKIFLKMFDRVFGLRPPPPMNPNPAVEMAAKRRRRRKNKTEAVRQHALSGASSLEQEITKETKRLIGASLLTSAPTQLKWPQRGTEGARRDFSTLLPLFPSVEILVPSGEMTWKSGLEPAHAGCHED